MENGIIYTTEEKMNILRVKDYLNSEYLDKWLETAAEIVKIFEDLSTEEKDLRDEVLKINGDLTILTDSTSEVDEDDTEQMKNLEEQIKLLENKIFNLSQQADSKSNDIDVYLKENKANNQFINEELKKIKSREFLIELKNSTENMSDDEEKKKK